MCGGHGPPSPPPMALLVVNLPRLHAEFEQTEEVMVVVITKDKCQDEELISSLDRYTL